jgi:hypothetical protein
MVVGRYHLGSSHDLIPSSLICLYLEGEGRVCVGVFCGGVFCGGKGDGKVGGIELGGVGRGTKK